MAGSLKGLSFNLRLLGNAITSSQLETELTDPVSLGAFKKMINISSIAKELASSSTTFDIICNSNRALTAFLTMPNGLKAVGENINSIARLCANGNALKALFSDYDSFNAFVSNAKCYENLKSQANAPGSKLKKQVFTTDGTFTPPSAEIHLMNIFLQGPGGDGASANFFGGNGGGGGEAKLISLSSNFPTTTQNIVVSSTTTSYNTSSAAKGQSGGEGSEGGGTTSNSYKQVNYADSSINFPWIFGSVNWTRKGGKGSTDNSDPAQAGLAGKGGTNGYVVYSPSTIGYTSTAGTGIGSGGGKGYYLGGSDPYRVNGENAQPYGNGGSGANSNSNGGPQDYVSGGLGGLGCVIIFWVEK